MTFYPEFDLGQLIPADYNPRLIDSEGFAALKESIKAYGVLKPIIARSNGTLVAGHQRSRALAELGIKTAPVYVIDNMNIADEVRFNQLHNGTGFDTGDEQAFVPPFAGETMAVIDSALVRGNLRARGAQLRKQINILILRYGAWGACVANYSGEVLADAQYALSCISTHKPLRVFYVPDEVSDDVRETFSRQYGEFSYQGLPRTTWTQARAQMNRLRTSGEKANSSMLYETAVLPYLSERRDAHVLDFGAGERDYYHRLLGKGHKVWAYEPYPKVGATIDVNAVVSMVTQLMTHLKIYGLFDAVVCDSVMNSTDRDEAQTAVLTSLNALCRVGGRVFFSGRKMERVNDVLRYTQAVNTKREIEFLDIEQYSAMFSAGMWVFQRFHSQEQAVNLATRFFADPEPVYTKTRTSWQVAANNTRHLPIRHRLKALRYEFDLPYPNGYRLGIADKLIDAYQMAIENDPKA